MDIIEIINKRYSTKEFDTTKKLTEDQISQIETLLQLAPSSLNLQPWHFVIVTSEEGKKQVANSAHGHYAYNQPKILDASAVVVFATKKHLSRKYLEHILEKEDKDGRYSNDEQKEGMHKVRKIVTFIQQYLTLNKNAWSEKQTYLNLGMFLLGVASLGLDSVPMEGVDLKKLTSDLQLDKEGYKATIVVALGYHKPSDFNAELPKSRLDKNEIITKI